MVTVKPGASEIEAPKPEYVSRYTQDQICLNSIMFSVSPKANQRMSSLCRRGRPRLSSTTSFIPNQRKERQTLEMPWWDLSKGGKDTVAYLTDASDLATRFTQLGRGKPVSKINDRILSGLGDEWDLFCMALAPTIDNITYHGHALIFLVSRPWGGDVVKEVLQPSWLHSLVWLRVSVPLQPSWTWRVTSIMGEDNGGIFLLTIISRKALGMGASFRYSPVWFRRRRRRSQGRWSKRSMGWRTRPKWPNSFTALH